MRTLYLAMLIGMLTVRIGGAQPVLVTTPIGSGDDVVEALVIQPDGRIVVAGSTDNGSDNDFAVVRYNPDGSLDTTFGTNGIVTTDIGGGTPDDALGVALQVDGKIVVGGRNTDFAVVRYNPDGSLDTSFDGDGIATTPVLASFDLGVRVAVQTDGKILLAGYSTNGADYDAALVRFNTDGSLDTSFDTDGIVTTPVGLGNDRANGLAVQSDGKIVLGGYARIGAQDDFFLIRYNTDGSLDTSFDTDGIVITAVAGTTDEFGHHMLLQPGGEIVLVGSGLVAGNRDIVVARYNSDGSLDTSFDTDGMTTTTVGLMSDFGFGVMYQPDGKLVVAGRTAFGANDDFALVRYNNNGTLDTSFDTDGIVTTDFGGLFDVANAVGRLADGKIVAAGASNNGANDDFALAIYEPNGAVATSAGSCAPLSVTEGAGTLTVTASGSYELRCNQAAGGGIDTFYDLAETTARSPATDLAAGTSGVMLTLHQANIASAGFVDHTVGRNDTGAILELLEATPTRVRIRNMAYHENGAGVVLSNTRLHGDYSIYPTGRIGLRWQRETSTNTAYDYYQLGLATHEMSSAPLNGWTYRSQSGGLPNGNTDDDFLLTHINAANARTDFLHIVHQDFPFSGIVSNNGAPATEQWGFANWEDNSAGTLTAGTETWDFVTYVKPTNLTSEVDSTVVSRRDDYRAPASLAVTIGAPWTDAGENASGDDFNEAESAYVLEMDPALGLRFDIDGSSTVRHTPFFKIRQWRSMVPPPTVTQAGSTIFLGLDYRSDVKPVARSYYANSLLWHSTMEDTGTALSSPDVGTAASINGGVTTVGGRYGNGLLFDFTSESISFAGAGNIDKNAGVVELWYRPNNAHLDGAARVLWSNEGDGTHHMSFEKTAADDLLFQIDNGGTVSTVTVASTDYQWSTFEWIHLRASWDTGAALGDQLRIFLNGNEPTHTDPVTPYASGSMVVGTNYVGGRWNATDDARGRIDEVRIFGRSGSPVSLAHGGLTSNTSEYLASNSRDFQLDFAPVDGSSRGRYLYFGADSKFLGLNVHLQTPGVGTTDLQWEYWNGAQWADLESGLSFVDNTNQFTEDGTLHWNQPGDWDVLSVHGAVALYYVRAHAVSGSYSTFPVEDGIKTDILLFQLCADIDQASPQQLVFGTPTPTAVELMSFEARGARAAVELSWATGSELDNLGFHLYRATSPDGPFVRITERAVPGLGSSPSGGSYSYADRNLTNELTYYYELEDLDASGETTRHGPVAATPRVLAPPLPDPAEEAFGHEALVGYGRPERNRVSVVERSRNRMVIELDTEGFYAEPAGDGAVRIFIPGFDERLEPGELTLPVKRQWIDVADGRDFEITKIHAIDVVTFDRLAPAVSDGLELVADRRGGVHLRRRRARSPGTSSTADAELARIAMQGSEAGAPKLLLELSPLRLDAARGSLVFAKRLRIEIQGTPRRPRRRSRDRTPLLQLATREAGLYAVDLREAFRGRVPSALHLSRLGLPVAYHVQDRTLYFVSPGGSANPFGTEAVFELAVAADGARMEMNRGPGSSSDHVPSYFWRERVFEENRYYQAGLVNAPDRWLWEPFLERDRKTFDFDLGSVAQAARASALTVKLQGTSDAPERPDHQVRFWLNGVPVAEHQWDGKRASEVTVEIPPGTLRSGRNSLEIEAIPAGAPSMMFLDAFSVRYPEPLDANTERVEGTFDDAACVAAPKVRYVLDVTGETPVWIGRDFCVQPGRTYLAVGEGQLRRPELRWVPKPRLARPRTGADYLVIAPRAFLSAATPLLEHRRSQGLETLSVALEDITLEFGHGEMSAGAIRDFLRHAYESWTRRPRYVVLLGDATYDFEDRLGTGVVNQVPPFMTKTAFLWTASDPMYAAVDGDDPLADFAIGRLPAASRVEAEAMVAKILAYESRVSTDDLSITLVADDPDNAGNFEQQARDLMAGVLAGQNAELLSLDTLGAPAVRESIRSRFDNGSDLMSYLGHGGIHLWASENLLQTEDMVTFSAQQRQPLVLTMNCLNGYFHFPYFDSLAEALVKPREKGAIAAVSPSGLSLNGPANEYHEILLHEVVHGRHARLGDALMAAQKRYVVAGRYTELLLLFHLIGDPALTISNGH